jgi:hypothetical protein
MTTDQYLARCEAVRGTTVQVAGYVARCGGLDCLLYSDKAGADAMQTRHRQPDATRRFIGIGHAEEFDRKAAGFQHSYVVISGRVDDFSCDGSGGTDRSAGIHPTDIRTWTPAEGAPAN